MSIEDLLNAAPAEADSPDALGVAPPEAPAAVEAPPLAPPIGAEGPPNAPPGPPPGMGQTIFGLGLPPPPAGPAPLPPLATPPPLSKGLSLALLASALLTRTPGATGLLQGVEYGHHQQTEDFLRNQAIQQAQAQRQAQLVEGQQKAYQDQVDKRGTQLTGVLTKLKTDLLKAPNADAANALIDQYGQALTAAGYRGFDGNSLRAKGYRYLTPDLEPQLYQQLDRLFKNPANKGAVESGDVLKGTLSYKDPATGLPHTMSVSDAITAANYPVTLVDGKLVKVADKPLTPTETAGAAGAYQDALKALIAGGAQDTPETRNKAREQAKVVTQTPARPPSVNVTMGATDATDMAQQLISGDLVPSQLSKRTTNYNEILATANRLSKEQTGQPYNAAQAQIQYEAAHRFATSQNSTNMVRFRGLGQSVVNTIDEVRRLSESMDQSGLQFANKAAMSAYLQLNSNSERGQLVAQYLAATNTLKEEFANLVNGGMAPTESAFALANQQINANYGVKALNAALTETQRLINYRLKAFGDLQPVGAGPASATPATAPSPVAPTIKTYNPATGRVE